MFGVGKERKKEKKPCLEMLMVEFKYLYVSALNQWLQLVDVCSRDCEMVPPLEWPTRSWQRLRHPLAFYVRPLCPAIIDELCQCLTPISIIF